MQPTKASTVVTRPDAAPMPRLGDQLKEFAARAASEPPTLTIALDSPPPMTEPVTTDEYDFFLAHPKSGELYPTAETAQAAEYEYDRILGKIFASEYQFKRNDGRAPVLTADEFLTLATMFGKYDAANNGLRPPRPGESFEDYTKSLDPKPVPTPPMPMFASNYDYRTQPLHWATDYRVYLDHQIAYLETELDRFMELTGRTADQRRAFFALNAEAACRVKDLAHPGVDGTPMFYPDLATDVLPLLDAASDILLTPAHRKFKLAPEQELDALAHYAAWGHADIAVRHQQDFVELLGTFDAIHEIANEKNKKTMPTRGRDSPRRGQSPARGRNDSTLAAVADSRRQEYEGRPQASTIASPFASAYRLRLDENTYRYSMAQVEDMQRAAESWCVASPAARLVLGATIVPFYPVQMRINEELDRIRALAPLQANGTRDYGALRGRSQNPEATARLISVLDEEASKRSTTKTLAAAMCNVAWDVFLAGVAGSVVSTLKTHTSVKFEDNLRKAESAFIAGSNNLASAARSGASGLYSVLNWATYGMIDAMLSTNTMEKLSAQIGEANVHAFLSNRTAIDNEAKNFFSGIPETAEYLSAQKMQMLNDLRDEMAREKKIPKKFEEAVGRNYDPEQIRATEERSAVKLAEKLTQTILNAGGANHQFTLERLEKLVGKEEATKTLAELSKLRVDLILLESGMAQRGTQVKTIEDTARDRLRQAQELSLRPAFSRLTQKCDKAACAVTSKDRGQISVDREEARAVAEINVAYHFLSAKAKELHDRTKTTNPPLDTTTIVADMRDYFEIRNWDMRSSSANFSEVTRYVVESAAGARFMLDQAFESNSAMRMKDIFVALDAAIRDPSGAYSKPVVLPGKGNVTIQITKSMADAINAGQITTNPEFDWQSAKTPEELRERAHLLREIRVGGVALPLGTSDVEALEIFTGLRRMRSMWTSDRATDLDAERRNADSLERLETDAREANKTLETLVETMFDATKGTRQELEDVILTNAHKMVILVREMREKLITVVSKIQEGALQVDKSFQDLTEALIAVSSGRRHHMSLADAIVDQLSSVAVYVNARNKSEEEKTLYSATFKVYADRLIRLHFGDVLSNMEHTLDEMMHVFNAGTNNDRFLLQKSHENAIREAIRKTSAWAEANTAAMLADDAKTLQAAEERAPAWFKTADANLNFRDLTPAQKAEYKTWLRDVHIPAAQALLESKGMRSIKNYLVDEEILQNRKSEVYRAALGDPPQGPEAGLRGILGSVASTTFGYFQSAIYAQNLANHMFATRQSRQLIVSGGNKLINQGVRLLLAGGAIPIGLMRMLRSMITSMGTDGFWGTFAAVLPVPNGSVFFKSLEVQTWFTSESTGLGYVGYLLTALVALSARSGFDLFAHQILPDKIVQRMTVRTDQVVNQIVAARVGEAKAKEEVANYFEQRFAAMQKGGAEVDTYIGERLGWMRRNDEEGLKKRTESRGFGWDTFSKNFITNSVVSLGVSAATVATQYVFVGMLAASERLSWNSAAIAVAIGHAAPMCASLVRHYLFNPNKPGTINAVSGGIGERWLLLKLIGRADTAKKLHEAVFETVPIEYDAQGRPTRRLTRLKYNVGDSPLIMMRSFGPLVDPPRWDQLTPREQNDFIANSLTDAERQDPMQEQIKAQALYSYLLTEMRTRDIFHSWMLAYNRSGDMWARSGLAIVPQLMAYVANACRRDSNGVPGANRDALTFASGLPTQAGAAIASLTTALTAAYGPTKSFSRDLLVSIFGTLSTMWAATYAEAIPAPLRTAFWFTMATMQGVNAASSWMDLAVKFFAKERAERETVRQFIDELYAVGGLDRLHEREDRVAFVRHATDVSRARLENHLLQMTVVGAKTAGDSYLQAALYMFDFMYENTLVRYVMEKAG